MLRLALKSKSRAKVAIALLATTSLLSLGNMGIQPAGADPAAKSALNGVGSDTLQDLGNALSGAEPYPPAAATIYSVPIHSSSVTGNKTINSWDAVPSGGGAVGCGSPGAIITTYGGTSFDRPNGSGNGIVALSHASDPSTVPGINNWWAGEPTVGGGPLNDPTTSCTGAPVSVAGQIDFARSSKGPKNVGLGQLTYIPIARDAVSFAYFDHGSGLVATLTTAQLQSLYSSATGTLVVGTETIHACITQKGSGTTKFWEGAIGVTDAQAQAASFASGCTANPSILEENGGDAFFAYANTLAANNDAVVDFSAGSWIAQANGAAQDRSSVARAGTTTNCIVGVTTCVVDMGAIDALGKPYTGTAPSEAPSATFYASTVYGRNINIVVPTAKIIGTRKNPALVSLFVGSTSALCSAGTTITKFGFLTIATCGSTSVVGNFYDTPGGTPTA